MNQARVGPCRSQPGVIDADPIGAAWMGVSFILGSLAPVVPYFVLPVHPAFRVSLAIGAVVLFGIGFGKAIVVHGNPITSGLQIMAIGSVAAILAYRLGTLLPEGLGQPPTGA